MSSDVYIQVIRQTMARQSYNSIFLWTKLKEFHWYISTGIDYNISLDEIFCNFYNPLL